MNYILNNIFLIAIALTCIVLLLLPTLQGRGPNIPPFQVTQKMNQGRVVILDLRKEEEYAENHLKNAIHIPASDLMNRLARIDRYKNEPIVIVDATGKQSAGAATAKLKKAGFTDVSSLEGGMKAWIDGGMPVEASEIEADKGSKGKKKGKA